MKELEKEVVVEVGKEANEEEEAVGGAAQAVQPDCAAGDE